MARESILLPAQIDLRVTPQAWTVGIAEYVGWTDNHYSGPDAVLRVVEPARYAKLMQRLWSKHLPERIRSQVPQDGPSGRFSHKLHTENQQRVRIEVLISDAPLETTPYNVPRPRKVDGWQMREAFLRLEHSTAALAEFLNRYGAWDRHTFPSQIFPHNALAKYERAWRPPVVGEDGSWWQPRIVVPNEIWHMDGLYRKSGSFKDLANSPLAETQSLFRAALTWRAEQWFDLSLSNIANQGGPRPVFPHFLIQAETCFDVIRTTITVDHLRGTKFRTCARPDCGLPFAIESRHKRAYCCQYCAHLESVRRNRTRSGKAQMAKERGK